MLISLISISFQQRERDEDGSWKRRGEIEKEVVASGGGEGEVVRKKNFGTRTCWVIESQY